MIRTLSAAALAAVLVFALPACSSDAPEPKPATTTPAPAPTPMAQVAALRGGVTAVTLNADSVKALTALGVKVTPLGNAKPASLPDGDAVAFPITGGNVTVYDPASGVTPYVVGRIEHKGAGLTFRAGSKTLTATDFVIDPGNPAQLFAKVTPGKGPAIKNVALFLLDGTTLKIEKDGSDLKLDGTKVLLLPAAARVIEGFFGAPPKAIPDNLPIGVAHITLPAK